jgi:hypothetical protein
MFGWDQNKRFSYFGWNVSANQNNCSTKVIIKSLRARIIAAGGTPGNLSCIASYLDLNITSDSVVECNIANLRKRIEDAGGVAGDLTCIENYLTLNFYD